MSLVAELRRRNVFRMAALYLVAAWLIMQVAEVVKGLANLPDWIGPATLGLLAIGFPIALVFSWFYEVTPEGISLEKDLEPGRSTSRITGRRMDFIVIALLSAALILFAVDKWWDAPASDLSIAVLPFENMSEKPGQEYFSDGISEELLNRLATIPHLRVISRTSSFAFKGKDVPITAVAAQLNVAHILEGSVRKAGNSVRITAQLIDADSDSHLWAETYDRELTTQNIFAIQSEIATAIAGKLQATLSQQDEANLRDVPTMSLEAYQAYLLGRQHMTSRVSASLEKAVSYFREAIERDPDYALAYVGLGETYMLLGDYAGLSRREMLANAEPAISKALDLDDKLAEAYVARGAIRGKVGDNAAAIDAFQRAIELDQNYSKAYHWYADTLLNSMRRPGAALPLAQKAYTLDPISPALIVTVGQSLAGLGRFEEAMEFYNKVLEIEPAYASTYYLIGSVQAYAYGRLDLAVGWSLDSAARDPRYVYNLGALAFYFLSLGDADQAEYWVDRALSTGPDRFSAIMAAAYLHLYRGEGAEALSAAQRLQAIAPGNNVTLYMLVAFGQYREATRIAAASYPQFSCEREPEVTRVNVFPAINLSLALEETGDRACANRLLEEALRQIETMPRLGFFGYGFADIEVYARLGRNDRALSALRTAIDQGTRIPWWSELERSPHTRSLQSDARFQAMLDEIRLDMSSQLDDLHDVTSP